ncbi:hypothetical protein FE257_010892 [Aspergillus nanangensis]|uniref:Autophagy protein 5 n=1 Tax=Aspergillus nanangensis TaxID=2582783 RepID=A0AAD4CVP1_ASPNN|nr:hypothetical protein FE257_010892 [Aspergillus nanangensis]
MPTESGFLVELTRIRDERTHRPVLESLCLKERKRLLNSVPLVYALTSSRVKMVTIAALRPSVDRLPSILATTAISIILYLLGCLIYNVFFHPLAKYPGPISRATSLVPYLYGLASGQHHTIVKELHQEYGDVVRIAPNKLSYITGQAWKDIYGHKKSNEVEMPKDPQWQAADPNAQHLVFSTREKHGHFRRLFSNGFSDRSLRAQEPLLQSYVDMLIDGLERAANDNKGPVDIVQWFNWTTFDIIGDLTFGESFGCLENTEMHSWVNNMFQAIKGNMVVRVMQEIPVIAPYSNTILRQVLPARALQRREDHFRFAKEKVRQRLNNHAPRPDFMDNVLRQPPGQGLTFPELLSNSALLIMAGNKMQKLVDELATAFPQGDMITIETTSRLTYLPAVIEETLRLYPPLAVGIPRLVPDGGYIIEGQYAPAGTSVAVHHLAAYHSDGNFEKAECFIPERFIDTAAFRARRDVLQPFSFGPRNCIGKNLAYAETKIILARLLARFELALDERSRNWIDQKTYVIWGKPPMYVSLKLRQQQEQAVRNKGQTLPTAATDMDNQATLNSIQKAVWEGRLPLQITLAPSESRTYDKSDPYLISYPRVSYLPSLLSRLRAFYSATLIEPNSQAHDGWFSFEGVPLKWHLPVGLLYDLYAGADPASKGSGGNSDDANWAADSTDDPLPWQLTVHFSDWPDEELVRLDADGMVMNDAFINSVKEADFLRNGTAKGIMSLSKEDSSGLWRSVQDVDLPSFQRISNILLPSPNQPFRNIPIRIFLPLPPDSGSPSLKVFQSPVPPNLPTSNMAASQAILSRASATPQPQTLGSVLHTLLPNLFPSRRTPVLAKPVLHGAALPMSAPIEEVVRSSAYGDGWVYLVIRMMG